MKIAIFATEQVKLKIIVIVTAILHLNVCGAWTTEEIERFYEYEEQFYNEDFEEEE